MNAIPDVLLVSMIIIVIIDEMKITNMYITKFPPIKRMDIRFITDDSL